MFVLSLFLPQGHAVGEGVADLVRCNDESGLGIPWGIDTLPLPVLYWGQFAKERKRPIMAEILDIVDEQGRPTGQTVPRAVAHAEGIRHRTSHVWILRRHAGRVEVLLQMRCQAKDSFPGCYDISSAGHIPAGCDFVESALRELREELGVTVPADALQECGVRHFTFEDVFHGRLFKDNQVSKVFCLWLDKDAEDFTVQKEEIDYVRWFGLEEAIEAVKNDTIPNCIYLEELEMVQKAVAH